ncbi:hypothetical protein CRG98_043437 [Punica granatum]|uniref:Growth-regulating factor n=2 Tax=Punica granatum TaxID=22663 RepID=A0A2I0HWT7_PUNGR|nr:hypothetical protein CRG98_043437 [Punica granatum]
MDFHLKQWRGQQQQGKSDVTEPNHQQQQSSAVSSTCAAAKAPKIPKLVFESSYPYSQSSFSNSTSAAGSATTTLPLFVPEEEGRRGGGGGGQQQEEEQEQEQGGAGDNSSNMGSYFSWAQWQELELQALIYRYMMAGATVPPELLQPIKKSLLLHSSPYFLHSHFPPPQYPPSAAWYWGRAAMDPEPGRCRRTDGKKWRCSRDVVAGQKYCERHMHRGRNRSRKPVEIPTTATSATANSTGDIFKTTCPITSAGGTTLSAMTGGGGSHFSLSGFSPSSSIDIFHLNQSYSSEVKPESRGGGLFGAENPADSRPDGHVLRHFFDDWPRSLQESDNTGGTDNSSTCLSISDVSLKLSTGNGDEPSRNPDRDHHPPMSTWAAGWGSNHVAPMGGPLAEALRSSLNATHSSPTSVLHHLPRGSASEASFVST